MGSSEVQYRIYRMQKKKKRIADALKLNTFPAFTAHYIPLLNNIPLRVETNFNVVFQFTMIVR